MKNFNNFKQKNSVKNDIKQKNNNFESEKNVTGFHLTKIKKWTDLKLKRNFWNWENIGNWKNVLSEKSFGNKKNWNNLKLIKNN